MRLSGTAFPCQRISPTSLLLVGGCYWVLCVGAFQIKCFSHRRIQFRLSRAARMQILVCLSRMEAMLARLIKMPKYIKTAFFQQLLQMQRRHFHCRVLPGTFASLLAERTFVFVAELLLTHQSRQLFSPGRAARTQAPKPRQTEPFVPCCLKCHRLDVLRSCKCSIV